MDTIHGYAMNVDNIQSDTNRQEEKIHYCYFGDTCIYMWEVKVASGANWCVPLKYGYILSISSRKL